MTFIAKIDGKVHHLNWLRIIKRGKCCVLDISCGYVFKQKTLPKDTTIEILEESQRATVSNGDGAEE